MGLPDAPTATSTTAAHAGAAAAPPRGDLARAVQKLARHASLDGLGARQRRVMRRTLAGADLGLDTDRARLIEVSRQLEQTSEIYEAYLATLEKYVVGTGGSGPQSSAGRTVGGVGGGIYPVPVGRSESAKLACRLFGEEADHLEHTGRLAWTPMVRTVVRALARDGEVFGNLTEAGTVQLIEADRCQGTARENPETLNWIWDGIEVDKQGRFTAYWFQSYDRRGNLLGGGKGSSGVRVDAAHVLHPATRTRPSQTHGLPAMAVAFRRLVDTDDYLDAAVTAAKICAMFAFAFKSPHAAARRDSLTGSRGADGRSATDTNNNNLMDVAPGSMFAIFEDESVEPVQSAHPSQQFDSFVGRLGRIIASAAGIPLEVMLGDFGQANFSRAKLANAMAEQTFDLWREILVSRFCQPLYRRWATRAVMEGRLPADPEVFAVRWTRPRMPSPDPLKDAQAAKLLTDSRLMTMRRWFESQGQDVDAELAELVGEAARFAPLREAAAPTDTPDDAEDRIEELVAEQLNP